MTIHTTEEMFKSVALVAVKAALLKINEVRHKCPGIGGDVDAANLRYCIKENLLDVPALNQALRMESTAESLGIECANEFAALRFVLGVLA